MGIGVPLLLHQLLAERILKQSSAQTRGLGPLRQLPPTPAETQMDQRRDAEQLQAAESFAPPRPRQSLTAEGYLLCK